jgi:hypothetical protein
MDILNFISWIASKRRVVKTLNKTDLIPIGVRTETRDDKYTTVAITAEAFIDEVLSQIPEPAYKVYTVLLTQGGGDNPSTILGDGTIDKGISYYISDNPDNEDLTLVGAPDNNPGTYFVATQTVTGAYTSNVVLAYNTGAPVATVLENTVGNIWFTYGGIGQYRVYSNSLFIEDKTTIDIDSFGNNGDITNFISNSTLNGSGEFRIYTYNTGFADTVLQKNRLEIRVYN